MEQREETYRKDYILGTISQIRADLMALEAIIYNDIDRQYTKNLTVSLTLSIDNIKGELDAKRST